MADSTERIQELYRHNSSPKASLATPGPAPQVHVACEDLDREVTDLFTQLARLEERLVPVLRPEPHDVPSGNAEVVLAPLATEITIAGQRTRHAANQIRQILDRLEV